MADFVFANYPISLAVNMSPSILRYWLDYDFLTQSSTTLSFMTPSNVPGAFYARVAYQGTDFATQVVDSRLTAVTAGVIEGITVGERTTDPIRITGLELSAPDFFANLLSGKQKAVYLALLAGDDSMRGGHLGDRLEGLAGKDTLRGGTGDDTLLGGARADVLHGEADHDLLQGGDGYDLLLGGAGNDTLRGGTGKDKLTGGAGRDAFVFDTAPGRDQRDKITDFRAADDVILLERDVFSGFATNGVILRSQYVAGNTATDAADRIIYDRETGILAYDSDGRGGAPRIVLAELVPGTSISFQDFVII